VATGADEFAFPVFQLMAAAGAPAPIFSGARRFGGEVEGAGFFSGGVLLFHDAGPPRISPFGG